MRGLLPFAAAAVFATPVVGGVVTSSAPEQVSVTFYRNPDRAPSERPNLQWLNGYALISEVRRINLPAGENEVRFEGVAGGILPQSAIVTGIAQGVLEKNRDAYLLSAGSLVERSLGRRVHLRRTNRATGSVREQEVVVRSGSSNGLVLQTAEGFEALRCTGLAETLAYEGVPAGLSPKPTLSVRARSSYPTEATVTLSYLASGFDWQANYVAELNEAEDRIDLLAWLTLANADETSFGGAQAQAVAGRPNSERRRPPPIEAPALHLRCWRSATTSDIEEVAAPVSAVDAEDIIVTGSRVAPAAAPPPPPPPAPMRSMEAAQEALGDLKLYRIPEPVTVAARSQKQVRFLNRQQVPVRFVFRTAWSSGTAPLAATRVLIIENKAKARLGVPLPSGQLLLLGKQGAEHLLVGEGSTTDKAVGETVEIDLGPARGIFAQTGATEGRQTITVTNDQPHQRVVEVELPEGAKGNATRNGRPIWRVSVPANGASSFRF